MSRRSRKPHSRLPILRGSRHHVLIVGSCAPSEDTRKSVVILATDSRRNVAGIAAFTPLLKVSIGSGLSTLAYQIINSL